MSGLVFDPDNPPSIRATQEANWDSAIRDLYYSRFPRPAEQIFSRNLCQEILLTDLTSIRSNTETTAVRPEVGEVSLGSNPQIDLSSFVLQPESMNSEAYRRIRDQLHNSPSSRYDFVPYREPSTAAHTQSTNRGPSPVTKTSDSKVMLLAALLSAEQARCQSKEDPEEQDNALGNLVEATPEVKARIAQGLAEYLSLVSEPTQAQPEQNMSLSRAERGFIDFLRRHVRTVQDIQVMNRETRNSGECILTVRIIT